MVGSWSLGRSFESFGVGMRMRGLIPIRIKLGVKGEELGYSVRIRFGGSNMSKVPRLNCLFVVFVVFVLNCPESEG
jgi:hypothetical protein